MLARVVGTQKWRRVAEEDRGTEQGYSAVSSLRQCAHKGRPYGYLGPYPVWGYGFRAAGSVPRVGEDSTHVLIFQEPWRNCGIGADWWGEMAQTWGWAGRGWCWMGHGRERVARESDAFFGYGGANRSGLAEVVRPGCALGRQGEIG